MVENIKKFLSNGWVESAIFIGMLFSPLLGPVAIVKFDIPIGLGLSIWSILFGLSNISAYLRGRRESLEISEGIQGSLKAFAKALEETKK